MGAGAEMWPKDGKATSECRLGDVVELLGQSVTVG